MVKAETTLKRMVSDDVLMHGVSVECKGTHQELVKEVKAILDSFMDNEDYKEDIFEIIEEIIDTEMEQLKKENK